MFFLNVYSEKKFEPQKKERFYSHSIVAGGFEEMS